MDAEALRKTKEHYNSHANLHEDRKQVSSMCTAPLIDLTSPRTPQIATYLKLMLPRHCKPEGKAKPCP